MLRKIQRGYTYLRAASQCENPSKDKLDELDSHVLTRRISDVQRTEQSLIPIGFARTYEAHPQKHLHTCRTYRIGFARTYEAHHFFYNFCRKLTHTGIGFARTYEAHPADLHRHYILGWLLDSHVLTRRIDTGVLGSIQLHIHAERKKSIPCRGSKMKKMISRILPFTPPVKSCLSVVHSLQ